MSWLINAAQLDKFRKNQKALIILDATWHMPLEGRDAKQEFLDKHIIGAQFFDINSFNDPSGDAPHPNMVLRDEKIISEKLGALGIRNDYKVIIYDNSKCHTACRALWMLQLFGHSSQLLYILDGGLAAWNNYGGKVESGECTMTAKPYTATIQNQHLRTLSQMKANLHHPQEQIIDARHPVRFSGGPESRPGVRPGHIPGSFSLPYTTLFEKNDCWRPVDKLRNMFTGIGVDLNSPIVSTCGSGMTAPVINFALELIGHTNNAVYNGSWTEWGSDKIHPGEASLGERPVKSCLDEQ